MPCKPLSCQCGSASVNHRLICAIMLLLALLNAYHLRIVLNIAITEMQGTRNESGVKMVDACPNLKYEEVQVKEAKFSWTNQEEAFILYAFYIGYLFSHIPGGWLCDIFGARHVLGTCVVASAVVNIFYPLAISKWGKIPAIALRMIIGFTQGPLYPAISNFLQSWAPKSERALLGGIAYSGSCLGTVSGSIFTGLMIKETGSWHTPFYVWGVIALAWYVIYLFTVFSRPESHPFILEEEKKFLEESIQKKKKLKVPWGRIFSSAPVWALVSGQFSHNLLFFTLFTNLPKYLKEVLKMDVRSNSIYTAVPFLLLWISIIICGYLGDVFLKREIMSLINIRRLWSAIAVVLPAALLLIVGYIGCQQILAVILFSLSIVFIGPFFSGIKVNVNDISMNYSGIIMAIVNGIGSTAGIVGPFLVGVLTKNHSLQSWQLVFWIMFGIALGTLLLYCIFCKGERQKWDFPEEEAVP